MAYHHVIWFSPISHHIIWYITVWIVPNRQVFLQFVPKCICNVVKLTWLECDVVCFFISSICYTRNIYLSVTLLCHSFFDWFSAYKILFYYVNELSTFLTSRITKNLTKKVVGQRYFYVSSRVAGLVTRLRPQPHVFILVTNWRSEDNGSLIFGPCQTFPRCQSNWFLLIGRPKWFLYRNRMQYGVSDGVKLTTETNPGTELPAFLR